MRKKHPVWGRHGSMAWLGRVDMSWFLWSQYTLLNFVLWFLVRNATSLPPPGPAINRLVLLTQLCSVAGTALLYKTTFSDPGFVPLHLGDADAVGSGRGGGPGGGEGDRAAQYSILRSPALRQGQWGQLCVSCKLVRPLRSKHCAVRDRCTEVFDHYCPWVGNTVGKANRHYFFGLLVFTAASLFLAALTGGLRLREGRGGVRSLTGGFWVIAFVAWICVLLLSTLAILMAQIQSICTNVTTNEMSNWHRYPHMKHPRSGIFRNPFDKGLKANVIECFTPWRQPMEGVTVELSPGVARGGNYRDGEPHEGTSLLSGMVGGNSGHVHGPSCRH